MKLNHINLVVSDVVATSQLFETYFNFKCIENKGDVIVVLKNADDFTLVIMADKEGDATYPKAFHIGFMQENVVAVTEIYGRLKSGGIVIGQEPKKIRDSFGFYFTFDNLMIEIGYIS